MEHNLNPHTIHRKSLDTAKFSINVNLFRTAGTRIASDGLKGRVYEVSLADLQNENDAERSFRKFKLVCEEVQVCKSDCYLFGRISNMMIKLRCSDS